MKSFHEDLLRAGAEFEGRLGSFSNHVETYIREVSSRLGDTGPMIERELRLKQVEFEHMIRQAFYRILDSEDPLLALQVFQEACLFVAGSLQSVLDTAVANGILANKREQIFLVRAGSA
jgi:hypothetical protein